MRRKNKKEELNFFMFELKIDDAKAFKDSVDAIATLIDESEFDINQNGMFLRAMDPSQIAMVDFKLPKESFEKFKVPEQTKIGLNLDDLARIMSRVRPGENLTLKLDSTGSRIELIFKGKTTRKFNLPLLDIGGMNPKTPSIEFDKK